MIGYKGFDKNFCCRGFQYEVGKTYKFDGEISICERGFHFCEKPLQVWAFYSPAQNRFALVEAVGKIVSDRNGKCCTDEIKIIKELTIDELIQCNIEKNDSSATNTGDYSSATNTGNCSSATNTGDRSSATNTGDRSSAMSTGDYSSATNTGKRSSASNTGKHSLAANTGDVSSAVVGGEKSLAVVFGQYCYAKGKVGCWLVLSEFEGDAPVDVKVFLVDGEKIKADTFYTLKDGKAVEMEEELK